MRKLSLYIATSLDGFIARSDGRVDWLDAIPNPNQLDYGYEAFLASVDTTLMGNNTYKTILGFGGEFPYADKINYVFSRSEQADTSFVRYSTDDPAVFVQSLKNGNGGAIWLIGGGQLNTHLLNARLIDEMIITVAPIILGTGIPLFGSDALETEWTTVRTEAFDTGLVQSIYTLTKNDARP